MNCFWLYVLESAKRIIKDAFNMFCSFATDGCRFEYGRMLGGSVDGRYDEIVGNGSRCWRWRWHGRWCHAISTRSEKEATSPLHSGPGLRIGEAIQATEIPQRTRKGTPCFSHPPHAYSGKFSIISIFINLYQQFFFYLQFSLYLASYKVDLNS